MRGALRALVATPVRQFQLDAMLTLAVVAWMAFAIRVFRAALPRGGLEATLADLTAGDVGERWFSFYVAILTWGHVPVLLLLALWGGALAGHSIVRAWRDPMDPLAMVPAGQDPDRYVPPSFMFWGALVLGVLTFSAGNLTPMTGPALFWDEYYGLTQWVALLWWAVALATVVAASLRMVRSHRQRRERERRRAAGRVAAAQRRTAPRETRLGGGPRRPAMSGPTRGYGRNESVRGQDAGEQLSFTEAAGLHRSGFGEVLDDAERDRIGAGAGGLMIVTLFCGLIGLGPVGLVTGAAARRGQRTSSWVGTIGMLLSAVQTVVLAGALGLALATG